MKRALNRYLPMVGFALAGVCGDAIAGWSVPALAIVLGIAGGTALGELLVWLSRPASSSDSHSCR
jgi:hypothetical protein